MPMSLDPRDAVPDWPERHYCPVAILLIHATSGVPNRWTKDCGSWACEAKCAMKNKSDLLGTANRMFRKWGSIAFIALPDDGKKTKTRIRQWKKRAGGAEVLWVVQDRSIHVYSDRPLVPDRFQESINTLNLNPDKAIEQLDKYSLELPGVVKTKPSPGNARNSSTGDWRSPIGHPASLVVVDRVFEAVKARFPGLTQAVAADYSAEDVFSYSQETYARLVENHGETTE